MRSKKAIYNITFSFVLQIISILSGLIIPRLIIGTFGSDTNGLLSSINQFLSYIVLLEAGVGGVVRAALFKPLSEKNTKQISSILKATESFFKKIAVIFVIYVLVIAIIFPFIVESEFSGFSIFTLVIIIGLSSFMQYYFGISYSILLNADQRRYISDTIQIITIIINVILVSIIIWVGGNIHIVRLGSAAIFMIRPVILGIYVKYIYKLDKAASPDNNAISQRWDGLGHHLSYFLRLNSDVVILTLFTNLAEISVYSVYNMIATGIQSLVTTFVSGVEAAFGSMIAKGEKDILSKNFDLVVFLSSSITIIIYTISVLLILPFVKIYTFGIIDVDYIRPSFSYVILAAGAVYCISLPYYTVTLAAGHYKKTRNIAFIEAGVKIISSILLVNFYGLTGLAFGTLIAMLYRMIVYGMYSYKNILGKNIANFFKRHLITVFNAGLIILILKMWFSTITANGYGEWCLYAILMILISILITIVLGVVFYLPDVKRVILIIKAISKKHHLKSKN